MTDADSPTSRPDAPAGSTSGTPTSGTPAPSGASPAAGATLRDSWWWSPTLAVVVGLVVAGYQLDSLRSPDPLWISWVVAAIGVVVALVGLVRLVRAYLSR
jgi:hypothetical protein